MSSDVYIDVFDNTASLLRMDTNELDNTNEEKDWAIAVDTIRIGHLSALLGISFDWFEWLQNFAHATDLINEHIIYTIIKTHRHLLKINKMASQYSEEWLLIKFGIKLTNISIDDVIPEQQLHQFLTKNIGKYWKIRVD